jgi:hypothetical protein
VTAVVEKKEPAVLTKPCAQCPWRLSNQGKRHFGSFYTKTNLRRLWNQVRGGGAQQSCHLTDPQHPDHIAAGAKPDSVASECPGSVILVMRELRKISEIDNGNVDKNTVTEYLRMRKKGLTESGLLYWVVSRHQLGGVQYLGGPKLPQVNEADPEIGLPEEFTV